MAWRALRSSAGGLLRPINSRLQQSEAADTLTAFAARLLSSASDAHSSSEGESFTADAAAGAVAPDSQRGHAAPANVGSDERRDGGSQTGDRRRRRSRYDRHHQQDRVSRGGSEKWLNRGYGAKDDDMPRAKIRVHYPVRISGFGRLAMRRDVQRLLADCNVQAEDVRLEYDPDSLNPRAFWTDLPTQELQERALAWSGANIAGRPISVVPVQGVQMQRAILNPLSMGSRGRYVLVLGIQENANLEDIVRFFDGYELMGNPVTVLKTMGEQRRPTMPRSQRSVAGVLRAVVRFACVEEAHRALREKQGGFVLNSPVALRVLQ